MDEADHKRPRPRSRVRKPPRRNLDDEMDVEFEEREVPDGFPSDRDDNSDG